MELALSQSSTAADADITCMEPSHLLHFLLPGRPLVSPPAGQLSLLAARISLVLAGASALLHLLGVAHLHDAPAAMAADKPHAVTPARPCCP